MCKIKGANILLRQNNSHDAYKEKIDVLLSNKDLILSLKDCGINTVSFVIYLENWENRMKVDYNYDELDKLFKLYANYGLNLALKFHIIRYSCNNYFDRFEDVICSLLDLNENIKLIFISNEESTFTNYWCAKTNYYPYKTLINNIHEKYPYVQISCSEYYHDFKRGRNFLQPLVDVYGFNFYPCGNEIQEVPTVNKLEETMINYSDLKTIDEKCYESNKEYFITEIGCPFYNYAHLKSYLWNGAISYTDSLIKNVEVNKIYIKSACNLLNKLKACKGMFLWNYGFNDHYSIYPHSLESIKEEWSDGSV